MANRWVLGSLTVIVWACSPAEQATDPVKPPAKVSVIGGADQIAAAGTPVLQAPSIRVADASGRPVAGLTVTFVVTAGGGSIDGATPETNSAGEATSGTWTLGPSASINRLEARVAGHDAVVIQARSWTVSPTSVALQSIGESQSMTASLGDSTSAVSLSMSTESRWLQEFPVLDNTALQSGVVRAAAPGSGRVQVRAFGMDLGTAAVSVVPTGPIVFSVSQPGWPKDPIVVIRGYRMNSLPAAGVLIGGATATKVTADSAQLRVDPGISLTTDCVMSATESVSFSGIATLWQGTVKRPVPVQPVAVGETRTMQGGAVCLKLPPQIGSYVLAQVDRSVMDRAATTREAYWDSVTVARYTYSVSDRRTAAAAAAAAAGSLWNPPVALRQFGGGSGTRHDTHIIRASGAASASIYDRGTPWALGDLISAPGIAGVDMPWRVMRLYPNNVLLAISQADSAKLWTPAVIAKLDSAYSFVLGSDGLRVFQTTFGGMSPVTSTGSGQYLTLLELRAQQGTAACRSGGARATSMQIGSVIVGVTPDGQGGIGNPPAVALVGLLAHEYAHSWDCMRTGLAGPRWSVEGLAAFVQDELYRVFMGITIDGNVGLSVGMVPTPSAGGFYTWWSLPSQGNFQNGYGESASFMRHVAWRLTHSHGVSWDAARAAVILGSSEGLYGKSLPAHPGLTSRVRQIAGAQWEPVDARLDWILSLAADDRATGAATEFRYAAVREVWRNTEALAFQNIWNISFYRGRITAGSGQSVSGSAFADGNGYILIDDPNGLGSALELKSGTATMVWRLLRYR